jgi:hypothetical protein
MPKVRAITKCFIDNALREEGEVFEYNGAKNVCVESLDAVTVPESEEPQPERRKPGRPRKASASTDGEMG